MTRGARFAAQALQVAAECAGASLFAQSGHVALTNEQANDLASRLATVLQSLGVLPGDRVGICAERTIESSVAVHSILRVGAAYVPLDPTAPAPRLRSVLADAGIAVVLAAAASVDLVTEAAMGPDNRPGIRSVVVMDGDPTASIRPGWLELISRSQVAASPPSDSGIAFEPDDLAAILYTSGSTGSPKGVCTSHGALTAFAEWAAAEVGLGPDDRVAAHAALHFDLSTFDLFSCPLAGAGAVVVSRSALVFPADFVANIDANEVTTIYAVPTVLGRLTGRSPDDATPLMPSVRTVMFAGEPFPLPALNRIRRRMPHARFLNLYGPTETNVCTFAVLPDSSVAIEDLPIGRAVPYCEVAVVDAQRRRVVGQGAGELAVVGESVTTGYWNDPEASDRALVPIEGLGPRGAFAYLTGDIVRIEEDGLLRFLHRADDQVKVRGVRIELGDVETAVAGVADVREAAVVAVPLPEGGSELVAFVVGDRVADVRPALIAALPPAFVPTRVVGIAALPTTSSGKVDRRALMRLGSRPT